jgi:serine protease Do
MRKKLLLPLVFAAGIVAGPATAQVRIDSKPGGVLRAFTTEDPKRAVIGVTTSTGSARDTLGILISSVTTGSPAEKAGLAEGDRLAAINGVNLKLAAADVGDPDMNDALSRRLLRELGKVKPGDEVDLRVYSGGQTRTVKVKTISAADLYETPATAVRKARTDLDNRAALGIALGSTGSKRDTLGVLIMGVDDDGPADKAGIEEGNRIASINGVNLRVAREDVSDEFMGGSRVGRLQREIEKLHPGDDVTLQVYADGHLKTVKLKAVKASELKSRSHSFMFNGPGFGGGVYRISPEDMNWERADIKQTIERAMEGMRTNLQSMKMVRPMIIDSIRSSLEPVRERLRELQLPRIRIRTEADDDSSGVVKVKAPMVIRNSA